MGGGGKGRRLRRASALEALFYPSQKPQDASKHMFEGETPEKKRYRGSQSLVWTGRKFRDQRRLGRSAA